ncbi:hypothetical protein QDA11_gp71 [Microbacterium phage Jayden]|uniref:Uncharacterized protein n=1 Tax=Microbacterium phage Jayden TaxID=2656550 RepID=A0A649VRW5_9CAUD|nr:hypothetical protein QDA11_gp71 [Microbacterium phage Jayden]QGJ95290.1 hypothetical protein PBI_JAYDEN_71 [Microbacterium phage Jayden]
MAEEPVQCGAPFAIAECILPLHHDGHHASSITPPPHVAAMYDQVLAGMQKSKRSLDRWRNAFIIFTAAQVAIAIIRTLEGAPS